MGDAMTDSGVDSELSPSSPDSVTETRTPGGLGVTEVVTGNRITAIPNFLAAAEISSSRSTSNTDTPIRIEKEK